MAPGLDEGGYFERSWGWLALGLAAVSALALLYREGVDLSVLELTILAALVGLLGWTLLSGAWGVPGTDAAPESTRALVYVTGLAALLLVVESRAVASLLAGLAAGIGALGAYGIVEWLASDDLDPFQGSLLAEPVGYANAMGILAAIGIVVSLGLASHARGVRRIAPLGLASGLALVLVLTQSRGAWLALGAGLLVSALIRLGRGRTYGRRTGVALATLVAGAVVVATVAAVGAGDALGDRSKYWETALDDARDHPLRGSGAGSFEEYWDVHGSPGIFVRDAHSLYLETLAELGIIGLVLLLVGLATPFVAIGRAPTGVAAAGFGGYVAYLVHTGYDWDWEMPAVTLAGLGCAVAVLTSARERNRVAIDGRARVIALASALLACAVAALLLITV